MRDLKYTLSIDQEEGLCCTVHLFNPLTPTLYIQRETNVIRRKGIPRPLAEVTKQFKMSYNARREAFRNSKRRRSGLPTGAVVTVSGAGGGGSSYRASSMARRSRYPRYLQVRGVKAFQMTVQPFALAFGQGTAGTQGIQFYGINAVPSAPTYTNSSRWGLTFSLAGCQNYINGGVVGTAPNVNYAEYTTLFDCYRIRKVEISMFYNSNSNILYYTWKPKNKKHKT